MADDDGVGNRGPLLTRLLLKNYKSIAATSVELRPLTLLAGANGAGKSNFLDALGFVADALRRTLDHALRERGGIAEVRRRSGGHPTHCGVRCEFRLPLGSGHYAFLIGSRSPGGFEVQAEECTVDGEGGAHFLVRSGEVVEMRGGGEHAVPAFPPAAKDRLYLARAAGLRAFHPVYEALANMRVYDLSVERLRAFQSPEPGGVLLADGANLTSVLRQAGESDPAAVERIERCLAAVHAGLEGVEVREMGPIETLEFRIQAPGGGDPWRFPASNMPEGTLRALAILLAVFGSGRETASVVAIEQPEAALHPAAAKTLLAALREACPATQILAATHSPELLAHIGQDDELVLAVSAEGGATGIAAVDAAGRDALSRSLSEGVPMRLNPPPGEIRLFGECEQRLPLFDHGELSGTGG